jgi:hypothetical protein
MKMSFRNTTILWGLLLGTLAFIPFAYYMERQDAFEVMNALIAALSIFTVIGGAREVYRILRLPAHDIRASHVLVVAISVGSIALAMTFISLWVWRAFPTSLHYIIDTWWVLFSRWWLSGAFILTIATQANSEGVITLAGWRRTFTLLSGAVILAVFLVYIGATHGE